MDSRILRQNIISLWLEWHFFDAPKSILQAWKNFLKFNLEYFSVPVLIKTFFSPWRRYGLSYGKRLDIGKYFEALTFNLMSRGIGAVLRLFFIFLGVLCEIFIVLAGIIIFFGWFVIPLLLFIGLLFGLYVLF